MLTLSTAFKMASTWRARRAPCAASLLTDVLWPASRWADTMKNWVPLALIRNLAYAAERRWLSGSPLSIGSSMAQEVE